MHVGILLIIFVIKIEQKLDKLAKGQKISKANYLVLKSSKKTNENLLSKQGRI